MRFAHALRPTRLWAAIITLCLATTALNAQWSNVASPPLQGDYWGYASAYLDGKIYTFGGVTNSSRDISNASLSYDIAGNSWTAGPNLFAGIYLAMGAASDGKIYVIGGQTGNFSANTILDGVTVYDPSQGSISVGPALPKKTTAGAAVALNGKIYVIGGIVVNGTALQTHQDLQVLDVATGQWSTLAGNVPYAAYNNMATTDGTYLYIAGGQAANNSGFTNAYRGTVNGNNVTWTPIANLPSVVASGGMDLLDGKPFVAGGISSTDGWTGAFSYDPQQNSWNSFFTLNETHSSSRMEGDGTTPILIAGSGTLVCAKAEAGEDAPVAVVGNTTFTLTIEEGQSTNASIGLGNNGTQALEASIDLSSTAWASAQNATVPAGQTGSLDIRIDGSNLTEGRYQATHMLTTNDPNNTDIEVSLDVWVTKAINLGPGMAVLEEAHGTWCPPCGEFGIPSVAQAEATYGDRLIVLSHHDKGGVRYDPFSTTAGEALNNRIGLNAFPTGSINRIPWNGERRVSSNAWNQTIATFLQNNPRALAGIEVMEYAYDEQTRRVTAKVKVTSALALNTSTGNTINLTAMIVEDGFEYNQAYQSAPTTRLIEHENVVRHYWPDNDGQPVSFPAESTSEDGDVIKPLGEAVVNVVFTVPQSTTPTSAGPLSSVPVSPEHCEIVFVASLNNGQALGPILGAIEMDLTEEMSAGPSIAVDWGTTSKNIGHEATGEFEYTVTNNTADPIEVDITRAAENLPNGWWSKICTGPSDCDDLDNVKYTIPGDGRHTFKVQIYGSTPEMTGTVRLVVRHGETTLQETYEATTGVSSVAVAGESNGLAIGEVTPNPASSTARIDVTLPQADDARLEVYTTDGRKVAVLFDGLLDAGSRTISADVSNLESGTYVLVFESGENKVSRTLTIVR